MTHPRHGQHYRIPALRLILGSALFVSARPANAAPPDGRSPDERIAFYSRKIAADPNLYPALTELGLAYFDKAKQTHDAAYLKEARFALHRSNDIQPNFDAMKGLAAVANYSHRFPDAIAWAEKASQANPTDDSVTAYLVEAHLGWGESDKAKTLVSDENTCAHSYFLSVARAQWLRAQGRIDQAVESYENAARLAVQQNAIGLQVWALVQCAGVYLDSAQHEKAVSFLEAAEVADAHDRELRIHQTELLEARGERDAALAAIERLIEEQPDPTLHARAASLARRLHDEPRARKHFEAAETIHARAIAAGEVYPLGALARLYRDAGRLGPACELAKRSVQFQRDDMARSLLKELEAATRAPNESSRPVPAAPE